MKIKSINGDLIYEDDEKSIRETVENAVLKQIRLENADLRGCNLRGAFLPKAYLSGCDFSGDDYSNGADLSNAYMRGCDLRGANLRQCNLQNAVISDSDLSNCNMPYSDLQGISLSGSNLEKAYMRGCDLQGANLRGCNLREVDITDSNLRDCDLRWTDTRDADFDCCATEGTKWNEHDNKTIYRNIRYVEVAEPTQNVIPTENGKHYIPNVPLNMFKTMKELDCQWDADAKCWYHDDPKIAKEAERLVREARERDGQSIDPSTSKKTDHEM